MKSYENPNLEDLPNEIWVDVLGYDGYFEVSNLGRIKSLAREVNTRFNTTYLKKEKIIKQTVSKYKRNGKIGINGLICVLPKGKTKSVGKIVFTSFNPDVEILKNECIMHINKNVLDNSLENLKKISRKESKNQDMILSKRTVIATKNNIIKAIKTNTKRRILITDTVTKKTYEYYKIEGCIIGKVLIRRYANTGKLVIPYKNSKHKNPLLVQIFKIDKSETL